MCGILEKGSDIFQPKYILTFCAAGDLFMVCAWTLDNLSQSLFVSHCFILDLAITVCLQIRWIDGD